MVRITLKNAKKSSLPTKNDFVTRWYVFLSIVFTRWICETSKKTQNSVIFHFLKGLVDFQANEMEKRSFDGPTNQMENFFFWIRILDALVDTIADGCVWHGLPGHQEAV